MKITIMDKLTGKIIKEGTEKTIDTNMWDTVKNEVTLDGKVYSLSMEDVVLLMRIEEKKTIIEVEDIENNRSIIEKEIEGIEKFLDG